MSVRGILIAFVIIEKCKKMQFFHGFSLFSRFVRMQSEIRTAHLMLNNFPHFLTPFSTFYTVIMLFNALSSGVSSNTTVYCISCCYSDCLYSQVTVAVLEIKKQVTWRTEEPIAEPTTDEQSRPLVGQQEFEGRVEGGGETVEIEDGE